MNNDSSYIRSVDFWSNWITVPIDIAVTLLLGADPEEDDNFENNEFSSQHSHIKALAFNHAKNSQPEFIPDNIKSFFKWQADPCVKLTELGGWAIKLNLVLDVPEGYPKKAQHTHKSTSELLENTLKTTHTSELLEIMQHCIAETWENHDPKRPPSNELINQWFDDNYKNNKLLTNNMKVAMRSIMRPEKYK